MFAPSEWRIVKLAFILALVAAALSFIIGCAAGDMRKPDRWSLHLSQGLGDDGSSSGTSTPPPHGASSGTWSSDGEAVVGLGVEWDTTPSAGRSVLARLDDLQDAFLARPEPVPAMVSMPSPDADPALLASLDGLTVGVRRLEEALAAQGVPPRDDGLPATTTPEELPEDQPVVTGEGLGWLGGGVVAILGSVLTLLVTYQKPAMAFVRSLFQGS